MLVELVGLVDFSGNVSIGFLNWWILLYVWFALVVSLKPELFEGMRFDFTKGLNQKFSLSHR